MKIFLILISLLYSAFSIADEYPVSLACNGTGTSGAVNLTLIIKSIFNGEGVLEGTPITFMQNNYENAEKVFSLIGWPKSQNTGNSKDIRNKVEITVNRFSGQFDVKVSNTYGGAVTGQAQGVCSPMTEKKF